MAGNTPFLSDFDPAAPGAVDVHRPVGEWHGEADLFASLAMGTASSGVRSLQEISGVPSLWAHAEAFYEVWSSPAPSAENQDKLREEAIASWRGLLTLIALREILPLDVRLHALKTDYSKAFLDTALRQFPPDLLGEHSEIGRTDARLGVVLYKDPREQQAAVAGLLVPATLVLPAREFLLPRHPAITWALNNGSDYSDSKSRYPLGDPARPGALRGRQRTALLTFLEGLDAEISTLHRKNQNDLRNPYFELRDRVTSFYNDMMALPGDPIGAFTLTAKDDFSSQLASTRPLSLLRQVPTQEETDGLPSDTDCEARLRPLPGLDQWRALFFSDDMQKEPIGDEENERVIWDQRSIYDVIEADVRRVVAEGPKDEEGRSVIVLTPDDLFTDRLVRLKWDQAKTVENNLFGDFPPFLLPITPAVLLLIDPRHLQENFRLIPDAEAGGFTAELKLVLKDSRGVERSFKARRRFSPNQIREQVVSLPNLAVWPSHQASDWTRYFVYGISGGSAFLDLQTPISQRELLQMTLEFQRNQGSVPAAIAAVPTDCAEFIDGQRLRGEWERIFQCHSAPEALWFAQAGAQGLFLLNLPDAPSVQPGTFWRAAVDFGASNTSVAVLRAAGQPDEARLLSFEDYTFVPCASTDPAQRDFEEVIDYALLQAHLEFFPPQRVESPFMTLLRRRFTSALGSGSEIGGMMIAYMQSARWIDRLSQGGSRYQSRLKWDPDTTKAEIEAFMRQLVLQVCFEARMGGVAPSSIEWRFTLPSSLPKAKAEQYTVLVEEILTSLPIEGQEGLKIGYPLESTAALSFMATKGKMAGTLPIVLDTGGHSTDIAVHSGIALKALWEGSIEIGGQHILIDDWASDALWPVASKVIASIGDLRGGETADVSALPESLRRIAVEMTINRFGLPSPEEAEDAAGEEGLHLLRRTQLRAEFVLFGLVEYLRIVFDSIEEIGEKHGSAVVGLNFSGRGSLLFTSILDGPPDIEGADLDQRLWDFWSNAPPPPNGTRPALKRFSPSSDAKSEVAVGAAGMRRVVDLRTALNTHPLPMGERFSLIAHPDDEPQALPPLEIAPLASVRLDRVTGEATDFNLSGLAEETVLPEFAAFCDRFQTARDADKAFFKEDYLDDLGGRARPQFGTVLAETIGSVNPDGFLQPLFIMCLRAALDSWNEIVV